MNLTFKGSPITLRGTPLKVGDTMPDITLMANDLSPVQTASLPGRKVFVVVPSLDTGVCDLEVKLFNEKASLIPGVSIYAVSIDLPFAQARWCGASGVSRVKTLSDYRDHSFGEKTGTYIEGIGLLTRSVFVVDEANKVVYAEYVPEVTEHPNYDGIFAFLAKK